MANEAREARDFIGQRRSATECQHTSVHTSYQKVKIYKVQGALSGCKANVMHIHPGVKPNLTTNNLSELVIWANTTVDMETEPSEI